MSFTAFRLPLAQESMPLELETSRLHLVGRAVNALAMNQYMVACKSTGAAAFVDCGASPTLFLNWAETYGYG